MTFPFPEYSDDFEAGSLDPDLWTLRQIEPRQVDFSADAYSGSRSVVVTVRDGDGGASCDTPCQRAEIRTHGRLRPRHRDEFWHSFAFRAAGDIAPTGSLRTVIGQWKAPGDRSPCLAQRFDNGVFHVTIQDGPARRVVAAAEGDPDRLDRFQDMVGELSREGPGALEAAQAFAQLKRAAARGTLFADDGPRRGQLEFLRAAAEGLGAAADPDEDLFEEFAYVHDLDAYAAPCSLQITRHDARKLPDPKVDWVRMDYRIKLGRRDNDPEFGPRRMGEVDIYADGALIAEVRGDIGYRLTKPPDHRTVYFKFGVYRNVTPGALHLSFDRFSQTATRP